MFHSFILELVNSQMNDKLQVETRKRPR